MSESSLLYRFLQGLFVSVMTVVPMPCVLLAIWTSRPLEWLATAATVLGFGAVYIGLLRIVARREVLRAKREASGSTA